MKALVLILFMATLAMGQARTAESIVTVPFSQLTANFRDGSVRHVVGADADANGVCIAGAFQMSATKLSGVWKCSSIPGSSASGGAPVNATFITQTPNAVLSNEQALSGMATGLLKNTAGTGVLSIAVAGTDFLTPTGNGSGLTALNASQLTSGTVPDGRFPAVLPVISGANLTSLNAAQISSGTLPDARFPAVLPPISGANLTNLNAANIASGTVAPARLGTGSGGATKFLREDNSWQVIPGGGDALTANPLSQFAATTSAQFAGVISNESGSGLVILQTSPTIITPTIADLTGVPHTHTNAAGGGQITDAALSSAVQISKGGTGQTTATAGFNSLDPLTTKGDLIVHDGTNSVRLPVGTNGQVLKANSATSTGLEWGTGGAGAGDVVGPASSTDNAVVRFDGTTGKLAQNSGVTVDDSNNVSTAGEIASGVGSSNAGTMQLGEGTALALVANTVQHIAHTDVPAGGLAYKWGSTAAGSGVLRVANSSDTMTVTQDAGISHLAASTSADLAGVLGDETGSGGGFVRATSPTLTTPNLGAATATTINGLTISASTGTLTIANAKTATVNNTLTFGGTDGTTHTFQGSDTIVGRATTDALSNKTYNGLTVSTTTGTLTIANGKTATVSNTVTLSGTDGSTVAFGGGGTVSYTIASGTSALGTSAIASGACATVVTTAATGTATTDVVWWGFNGDPTATTGYQASVNGMLTIIAYPSANNVNFKVCNNTASSITPGAVTLNWRIVR